MEQTSPTQRLQQLLPRLFSNDRVPGERYLLFQITEEISAAIALEQVWEATALTATAITPIPQMPSYVLGWSTGRDRVYCVISLAEFLGLETTTKIPQQYSTIVVQLPPKETSSTGGESLLLGVAVNNIRRTVGISSEEIVSPIDEFPAELVPYLRGSLQREEEQIAVLDLMAIAKEIQGNTNS